LTGARTQRPGESEALRAVSRHDVRVERRLAESPEQAEDVGFIGSPTIRIDGTDPFASGDEPVGLMCRLYETAAGRSGSPTTAQLREVLS
jgi:hypothetical protein